MAKKKPPKKKKFTQRRRTFLYFYSVKSNRIALKRIPFASDRSRKNRLLRSRKFPRWGREEDFPCAILHQKRIRSTLENRQAFRSIVLVEKKKAEGKISRNYRRRANSRASKRTGILVKSRKTWPCPC